jgi:hypothetical protein
MKEIYKFTIDRKIEKTKPIVKRGESGEPIESTETNVEIIKHGIVFGKPSMSMIEEAEFFYGQKFNEYINSGFLTKAMLNKKMGDLGGLSSKISIEGLQKLITDNLEASRVIEFYGGSKTLTEEQQEKLDSAKEIFSSTRVQVIEYEQALRSQFSQTADVKAEQKLIEWLVFNLSFFEDEVDGKKQLFPIFDGDSFEEKRAIYLELCESLEDISDPSLYKVKAIFDASFKTLVRVASIWYNKIAEKQADIDAAIKDMFEGEDPEKTEKEEVKVDTKEIHAEPAVDNG